MSAIETILKRLKHCHGSDRELDTLIHCVLNPPRIVHPKLPAGHTMVPLDSDAKNARLAASEFRDEVTSHQQN